MARPPRTVNAGLRELLAAEFARVVEAWPTEGGRERVARFAAGGEAVFSAGFLHRALSAAGHPDADRFTFARVGDTAYRLTTDDELEEVAR